MITESHIGDRNREQQTVAGVIMSGAKRKVEELGGHVLSAAVSDVVARTMSTAVGRYEAQDSVDDQVARLRTLLIMVHSVVDEAERVHIASWWLRRWLWTLRDAALEGDEVLRLLRSRQQRAAEEEAASMQQAAGARNTLWNAAARAFRSARSLLLPLLSSDDDPTQRLRCALAVLEREAKGLGDFLKLLDLEIRRGHEERFIAAAASTTYMGMGRARAHFRQVAASSLIQHTNELHDMVSRIRAAAVFATGQAEFLGNRNRWLDEWRGELLAVAGRAERVLLTVPLKAGRDGADDVDGEEVRRTAQSVEAAVAHLEDLFALVSLARRQMKTPQRCGGTGIIYIHPQARSFFFHSLPFFLLFSLCVAAALLGWPHGWAEVHDGRRALPLRW